MILTETKFKTLIVFLSLSLICSSKGKLTFPIYHPSPASKPGAHPSQTHDLSNVIYHNMRNLPTHHLRHQLHLAAMKETHHIIQMGYFFTLPMKVAGLQYHLNVDTGSSDIFIKGEDSPGQPKIKYSCPICRRQNPQYPIGYLDGMLQTYLKNLPIEFGTHQFKMDLLVAYTAPQTFKKPQGIVGLSFPKLARNPNPTFIQTLINNKYIDTYSFGVNLNFQNNHSSSITFGEPNHELFEGQLLKVKLSSQHTYRIPIDSVQLADGPHLDVRQALLDTGNSCMSLPDKFQSLILNVFNNAGKGKNNCGFDQQPFAPMFKLLRCVVRDFQLLPTLSIWIEGHRLVIDKDAYVQRCVWSGPASLCDMYIESYAYSSQILLGDGFFMRFYTYFDLDNKQVGFAKKVDKLSYTHMYKSPKILDDEDKRFFKNLS